MQGLGHVPRPRNYIHESIAFRSKFPCEMPPAFLTFTHYCIEYKPQTRVSAKSENGLKHFYLWLIFICLILACLPVPRLQRIQVNLPLYPEKTKVLGLPLCSFVVTKGQSRVASLL